MQSHTTTSDAYSLSDLCTVDQMAEENPTILSKATLRWQLRHRDENGLAEACVKSGKNLLLIRPLYTKWLISRKGAPVKGA